MAVAIASEEVLPSVWEDAPTAADVLSRVERRRLSRVERRRVRRRGHLRLVAAAAVTLVGVAALIVVYAQARSASPHYDLFWIGTICTLAPLWLYALSRRSSDSTVVGSVSLIGIASFIPSYLRAPGRPVFGDSMAHYLSVEEALRNGQLLSSNAIVPIAKYYPGLHVITAGIVKLTGAPIWAVALVLICACHIATVLGIYAVVRGISGNRRSAALAAVVYSISPQYLFFDGLFAYESLAIPLLLWTLAFALHAGKLAGRPSCKVLVAMSTAAGLCCLLTHHLTSYALVALLLAIGVGQMLFHNRSQARIFLLLGAFLGLSAAGWVILTRAPVVSYLDYFPRTAFDATGSIVRKLLGQRTAISPAPGAGGGGGPVSTRSLFSGSTLPRYEQLAAYAAQVIAALAFLISVWRLRRRLNGPLVVLALLGITYFLLLPLRLNAAGEASAGRVSTYQWIGIAVLVGIGLGETGKNRGRNPEQIRPQRSWSRMNFGVLVPIIGLLLLLVTLVGNYGTGVNAAELFPGQFQLDSSNGTDTPMQAVKLAEWFLKAEGPNGRVVSDASTERVFETYAYTQDLGSFPQWEFFYASAKSYSSAFLAAQARIGNITAIVIDDRIAEPQYGLPLFSGYPPADLPEVRPGSLHMLESLPWVRVLRRSGPYEILQVVGSP